MEGPRLPPSSTSHKSDDDKPDVCHHPTTSSLPPLPSQDPPDSIPHELETYVVQVPRDQVYWTPPPEHAEYVEKRRNYKPDKNNKKGSSKPLMCFFFIFIIFGFIFGAIITLILHYSFKPTLPDFVVQRLTINPSNFEVMLKAENPTSNMGVMMKTTDDVASLTYKNKSLGRGKFPNMSLAASASHNVKVKLDGSTKNVVMPPRGSKQPVVLMLKMKLKAEYEAGPVKKNREVVVTCDVKVKGLLDATNVEIVSENCESEFKN